MPLSPTLAGEYLICKRRGHTPIANAGDKTVPTYNGFMTCKFCGTHYRERLVPLMEEKNIPTEAEGVEAN